jgi:hypothetical protein
VAEFLYRGNEEVAWQELSSFVSFTCFSLSALNLSTYSRMVKAFLYKKYEMQTIVEVGIVKGIENESCINVPFPGSFSCIYVVPF